MSYTKDYDRRAIEFKNNTVVANPELPVVSFVSIALFIRTFMAAGNAGISFFTASL